MDDKLLLYIDLLGFSDMADQPDRVEKLYAIIDSLNVHNHDAFETIVFSDTVLVYNKVEPRSLEDTKVTVMFLCEFAQDLLYRLIGKDIYFRAYLTYGEFEHKSLTHIDSFYGPALVRAYQRSNEIQCIGLFMDNMLVPYSDIFETKFFNDSCYHVAITQNLGHLSYAAKAYPLHPDLLVETDLLYLVSYDITFLKNIYTHMNGDAFSQRIKRKYVNTWRVLKRHFPVLLRTLEKAQFNPRALCDVDWSDAMQRVGTDRGFHG
jgi:hypothetical protein